MAPYALPITDSCIQTGMPRAMVCRMGRPLMTNLPVRENAVVKTATKTIPPMEFFAEHGMFLTVSDLTGLLKVSRHTVDRMLRSGQLLAAKLGNRYRVRTDDFLKWWDNQVKQEQRNILKNLVS